MDDELDRYAGHEVLRAILDQGCDPKEYGRHYEARLRQAELESIQDYLSESDNLVTLHQQVCALLQPEERDHKHCHAMAISLSAKLLKASLLGPALFTAYHAGCVWESA